LCIFRFVRLGILRRGRVPPLPGKSPPGNICVNLKEEILKKQIMYRLIRIACIIVAFDCYSVNELIAQSADSLINNLRSIQNKLESNPAYRQDLISNRAMNLFIADQIGSYLSEDKNLSFFKNYVTMDAARGILSLNHNFFESKGLDEPVRTFMVVGAKANVLNAFYSINSNKTYVNNFGVSVQKNWISKPTIILNNELDKKKMDLLRAIMLKKLEREINKKDEEFHELISSTKPSAISDSDLLKSKEWLSKEFYSALSDEYNYQFAYLQYQALKESSDYRNVSLHWTNIYVYLPVILERFLVADSLSSYTHTKSCYPFELSVSHTRFIEGPKFGKLFYSLNLNVVLNNAVSNKSLHELDFGDYRFAGGVDTSRLSQAGINTIYIGHYKLYLTPSLKFDVAYFPGQSHIGISASIQQNFGTWHPLNLSLGAPIVLIDKKGSPAANFQFIVQYLDVFHSENANSSFHSNIYINLTLGIPFSKIIY
jgi:hypothetical protein